MVLGAATGGTVQPRSGVVLALIDVTEQGIEHVAVYGGSGGLVTDMLGSREVGPFDTQLETIQWLYRCLIGYTPPLVR
jgi:hypothetical protein